jgi:hypothetical protein
MRSFKMADNQSPIPQDRVFFNFNYFNNINQSVIRETGLPIFDIQVYRYQYGFEKTFLDGYASIGIRNSVDSLSASSSVPGLGGTSTAFGDIDVFFKYVLWQNFRPSPSASAPGGPFSYPSLFGARRDGGLVSVGLNVRAPTGPSDFAGSTFSRGYRNAALQPFLGSYWSRGNFYLQSVESLYVPTSNQDVTMLYNDIGIGYFVYRNEDPQARIRAIAPTFEVHANIPLNHRGNLSTPDRAASPDIVDLTYGVNTLLGSRSLLSTGIVTPVTGPRPFDFEVVAMLNIYFGGKRRPTNGPMAPPLY